MTLAEQLIEEDPLVHKKAAAELEKLSKEADQAERDYENALGKEYAKGKGPKYSTPGGI